MKKLVLLVLTLLVHVGAYAGAWWLLPTAVVGAGVGIGVSQSHKRYCKYSEYRARHPHRCRHWYDDHDYEDDESGEPQESSEQASRE